MSDHGHLDAVPTHLVDGLDLSAVRLLMAVAELGSIAKAARRVGISQPSATVKLRKLERLLGVPLIQRSATGSALTGGGDAVADAGRATLTAASQLFRAAERGRDGGARLEIATTRGIASTHLDGLLARTAITEMVIDIVEADTRSVANLVRSGRVALGFVDGPFAPLGLRSLLVGEVALIGVCATQHRLANARSVQPSDIVEAGLVVRREGSGTRDVIEVAFAEHGFGEQTPLIEVDSTAAVLASVRTGRGVGLVPQATAAEALADHSLATVSLAVEVRQPIRVCWAGTRPANRHAERIIDALGSPR